MQYELHIDDILFYGVDEYIDMIIYNRFLYCDRCTRMIYHMDICYFVRTG